jgi:hypothetical protein
LDRIAAAIVGAMGKKLSWSHLAQIASVMPTAYSVPLHATFSPHLSFFASMTKH